MLMQKLGLKKNEGFQPGSYFDVLMGLTATLWVFGIWFVWICWPHKFRGFGSAPIELWIGLAFMALPLLLSFHAWNLWTGRHKAEEFFEDSANSPAMADLERFLSGPGGVVLAKMAMALALGMPFAMLGALGWIPPFWAANSLAYAVGFGFLLLGTLTVIFHTKEPAKSPRWVANTLCGCGFFLLICPELWTPVVWVCFPGMTLTEAPLIR